MADVCACRENDLCFRHKLAYWRERGGFNLSPAATPSRRNNIAPSTPKNSWEKGIPTDNRGMPYLDHNGSTIGQKEWGDKWRRRFDDQKRRNTNTPVAPALT